MEAASEKQEPAEQTKQKVIVYVDGYNFYNGLRQNNWRKYYWLDMVKFFETFMSPNQELAKVKYFSTISNQENKKKRQGKFFSANKLNPRFELILGSFMPKNIDCPHCTGNFNMDEEKKTDVNIATQLISDSIQNNCSISIVVSGDSDLTPPIEFIKGFVPTHKISVFFPPHRLGSHLKQIAHNSLNLESYKARFKSCQLPDEIELPSTYKLLRPDKWN